MGKGRLEAFSDGVLAIIITIMVLEMKVPHGDSWKDLEGIFPVFLSYILSFIYIGIYWNNHHHMLQAVHHISGGVMWANMHLLFWLSLVPFVSGWMGENHFTTIPVLLYGVVLLMNAIAYFILSKKLIHLHGKNSTLAAAIGRDTKGIISVFLYLAGIGLSFVNTAFSLAVYTLVAVIWFIPDQRIEKKILEHEHHPEKDLV
jgi:uncharacterized membrane protein